VQLRQGFAQTNVGDQQVTSLWHSATDAQQWAFNRDASAEFEVIANRFDATQGHSQGMVVNAITRWDEYLRRRPGGLLPQPTKFNARDFVRRRATF